MRLLGRIESRAGLFHHGGPAAIRFEAACIGKVLSSNNMMARTVVRMKARSKEEGEASMGAKSFSLDLGDACLLFS